MPEEGYVPVAFIDDDPVKIGRLIHGLPVRAGAPEIPSLLANGLADVVIVTTRRISNEQAAAVALRAGPSRVRRLRFVLEDVILPPSPSTLPPPP